MELIGSGGGGKSPPPPPIEKDDTLQSRQVVKLLFAISEGEIESLEDILLNNIPISTYNASYIFRAGTVGQAVIPGFIDTEEPVPSFAPTSLVTGTEYFVSVGYLANSCRITLTLGNLKSVAANNDTVGYSVSYNVYTRASASALWTSATTITKTGKASSPYSWDTSIPAPEGVTIASDWSIKLVRTTVVDDGKHFSPTTWAAATAVTESTLTYDNTALVGITLLDADQFGGNIPEITFKPRGLKVKIPTNYDPVNHIYDESTPWDLSLTEGLFHYTANPAWLLYMVLNHSRYGLNISKADIDVVSLYELSKVSDELVSDGKGGQERRFELHNQFYTREKPSVLLMHILTVCNANFTTNEFGQISIMFDRPGQAVTKQVTNANVIDGEFSYSSSELDSRYNLVNVTYNREEFNGKTDTANATEATLIDRYGLQTSDIVLAGCVSEAQAIRKARWAIYTSSYLPNVVSYKTFFAGLSYHVGEVIRLFDNDNQGENVAGLIVSSSQSGGNTTLQLDRGVVFTNHPYTVYFLEEDGLTELEYSIFESDQTSSTVTFVGLVVPAVNSTFILAGAIKDRLFKVIKLLKNEEVYEVVVVEHKEEKYVYIDQAIVVATPTGDFLDIGEFTTVPVSNIVVVENFSSNGAVHNASLDVSWDWSKGSSSYAASFILSWKRDSQESHFVTDIFGAGYDIKDPVPGLYEITVWSVNPVSGIRSTPVTQTYNFRSTASVSSLLPPENVFVAGTSGLVFNTQDLHLNFAYPFANGAVSDSLLDYVVEVWDTSTTALKGTYVVNTNELLGGSFSFPFTENVDRFVTATREFSIKVFSRDLMGDLSNPVQVTVNNPVPMPPSFSLLSGSESAFVDITISTELDVIGYEVHRVSAPDTLAFTPTPATLLNKGPDTYITLAGVSGTQYFYKVGAYDSFGTTGIIYSNGQSSTMLQGGDVSVWVFDGLLFKPNDPATNRVSWTAGSASVDGTTPITINAGNSSTPWTSGIQYFYYDGSSNTISVTSNLSIAVTGAMVLATYKGGTSLTVGNGDAFTDGALLLAGTVGANQLVVDSAVITNVAQMGGLVVGAAQMRELAVTSEILANEIHSINYNAITETGWNLDRTSGLTLYDGNIKMVGAGVFSIKSSNSGARQETTEKGIRIYDASGTLRVKLGDLT